MPKTPVNSVRIPPSLKHRIDSARGDQSASAWLREAAQRRLESDRGLGPEYTEQLAQLATQLRGLGTNLNQLAHAANQGRPVALDRKLAEGLHVLLSETRSVLFQVNDKL